MKYKIDNLQYCNWTREVFEINRQAELDAVHVTIVYHEDYNEFLNEIKKWQKLFEKNSDLIFQGTNFKDIEKAKLEKKTAIFFGFQNCSPIEDDISLVEKVHKLGCRFMQLTYNNQSLLATGCYEKIDSGVTNFGREVIKEMNRVGIVIDEYGSVKGLLSLEDILGEIVGELAKNNDDSKFEIMEQRDGSFLIDASVPIREINRKLQCDLPLNGPRTLNGLILEQIETIPEANVSITIQNVIIETVLVRNNMIKIARLFKSTEEEDSED